MTEPRPVDRSLRMARDVFSPSREQLERVRAALDARLAPHDPAPTATTAATPASRIGAWLRARALMKGGVLLGLGFALGYWYADRREDAPAASIVARALTEQSAPSAESALGAAPTTLPPSPLAPSPLQPSPPLALAPSAEPMSLAAPDDAPAASATPHSPNAKPRTARARGAARAHPQPTSAEELSLLQRAERAIRARNGSLARSFVAELESRFPETTWREERNAILVLAACALGEPGAERAARDFLERHPASVYADRIMDFCHLPASAAASSVATTNGSPEPGH